MLRDFLPFFFLQKMSRILDHDRWLLCGGGDQPAKKQVSAAGDGIFFRNSKVGFRHIADGTSKTILVGERSSRLGCTTWVGVIKGAEALRARVVGVADHSPNDSSGHFDDFSSDRLTPPME